MNKILVKKDVDEAIRLEKKYFRKGDTDILPAYHAALEKTFGRDSMWIGNITKGLTIKRSGYNEPYSTYYKVLECLGYQVEGDQATEGAGGEKDE